MTARPQAFPERAWLELPDGQQHAFTDECRIGRSAEGNDLAIDERAVSGRHAIISLDKGAFTLVDQRSTNGTYLNGLLVQKPMRLKDGDEIRLAKVVTLRFRCTREEPVVTEGELQKTTMVIPDLEERTCWLLLADVENFSTLIARYQSEAAVQRLQAWIAGMRPLIEGNGGLINRYVGDAIFACWACSHSEPAAVLAAVRAIEDYRRLAPVPFRLVLHHGPVFATRSDVGEELTGREVNFLFRSEKIAKRFGSRAILSQEAVSSLGLAGKCDTLGTSAVEGIEGNFTYFRLPRDMVAGSGGPLRMLLVEETATSGAEIQQLLASDRLLKVCDRAQHGASARRLHAAHKPDLVLIDLVQRTGESLALAGDLLDADPQTRILIYAAKSDPAYAERAAAAGVLGCVLKADATDLLLAAIRTVGGGGKYFSPQLSPPAPPPTAGKPPDLLTLTERELEIFRRLGQGQSGKEIAAALRIGLATVEVLLDDIRSKLALASTAELAARARKWIEAGRDSP
jgi:DNA-binding NarL/FixJ family response regulator